jgi:DNA-binding SARP family transcriptional activator
MRIDLLGPIQVRDGQGAMPLPRGQLRVVLAVLALAGGRSVTAEALIAKVWGEDLPEHPSASLANLLYRLRQALGRDAVRGTTDGYSLSVGPDDVDVLRFRRLLARLTDERDPAAARALLTEALELWRGEPLSGAASETLREVEVPRLTEEYLAAREQRIALDLAGGRRDQALEELNELTARYPLRETLWCQLLLGLAAAGRQAEALAAYEVARRRLREELGTDPSRELREVHRRLLTGQVPPAAPGTEPATPPATLPATVADFTGRDDELHRLAGAGGADRFGVTIVAIDGMAGVGKTALALRAAHRAAAGYPDGQLFLDLLGHTPGRRPVEPPEALGALLRMVGVDGASIPEPLAERAALWRSTLAGRRVLVVLDNAADTAQVRPLLPGTGGSRVLVTSRHRMGDLDATETVSLDVLAAGPARELFTVLAGARRAAAEPAAVDALLRDCGYLPLAIRVAGGRLRARPSWRVSDLLALLREAGGRLGELAVGDRSVASAFQVSYTQLPAAQQRLFRLLGLLPGAGVDRWGAAALAGTGTGEVVPSLAALVDAHLLEEPAPGRYRFHDLLREHARQVVAADEPADERRRAEERLLDYYLAVAERANRLLLARRGLPWAGPMTRPAAVPTLDDYQAAWDWLEAERADLLAAVRHAARTGRYEHAWRLPYHLGFFLSASGDATRAVEVHEVALAAARRLDRQHTLAVLLSNLSAILFGCGRMPEALAAAEEGAAVGGRIGEPGPQARALINAANALYRMGRYRQAQDRYTQAAPLVGPELTDQAVLNINLALIASRLGDHDTARGHAAQAWRLAQLLPDGRLHAGALLALGETDRATGRYQEASRRFGQALAAGRQRRDLDDQAEALAAMGRTESGQGRHTSAVSLLRQALRLAEQLGNASSQAEYLNHLGETLRATGHRNWAARVHRTALRNAETSGNAYEQARAHAGLSDALHGGDPSAARHADAASDLFDRLDLPDVQRLSLLCPRQAATTEGEKCEGAGMDLA